jgi:ribosome-associated protein
LRATACLNPDRDDVDRVALSTFALPTLAGPGTMRADVAGAFHRMQDRTTAMIQIDGHTILSEDELVVKVSRSSGPGGQNVNKVNTRVTLLLDVAASTSFSDAQKRRIREALATRIDKCGVLRVVSQKHRTQEANRRAALERLCELLGEALKPKPVRRKTRVPARAREQRLKDKKHRSVLKNQRTNKDWEHE